jgi:hypothetical protein
MNYDDVTITHGSRKYYDREKYRHDSEDKDPKPPWRVQQSECGVVGHGGVLAFAVSMLKFTVRKLTHSSVVGSSDQTSVTMNAP